MYSIYKIPGTHWMFSKGSQISLNLSCPLLPLGSLGIEHCKLNCHSSTFTFRILKFLYLLERAFLCLNIYHPSVSCVQTSVKKTNELNWPVDSLTFPIQCDPSKPPSVCNVFLLHVPCGIVLISPRRLPWQHFLKSTPSLSPELFLQAAVGFDAQAREVTICDDNCDTHFNFR